MNKQFIARQQSMKQAMAVEGLSALLVLGHENIRYLSGFSGNAAYALITAEQFVLITDYRYFGRAQEECTGFEVICRDRDNETLGQCISRFLASNSQLGFDAAFINVALWQQVSSELTSHTLTPVTGMVERLRMVKSDWEVAQIKAAAAIADEALKQTLPYFKAGVSERDLALELEFRMQKLGSEGMSFATILMFAERTSLPHGSPSECTLKEGDFITLDFGAVVNGYRSDMTRSYVLGQASTKQTAIYNSVATAQQAAIDLLKPGVHCTDLQNASQHVLDASGFGDHAGQGLGHGLGLFLHEQPFINSNVKHILEVGNVITIEPGIYIPEYGGVRLEEDILITNTGYEILTHAPKPFELEL
ncbi:MULTISPECIES: Xaa-Pro peptidase family protein [unclassified Pseudoalteromonas]|uniref:M24 family metallopeptidase n=1 Tax=unclassified Pseudoalteromonas TaxID=194690 RepID=UPI0025B2D88E|nr:MULTISPECIES: Xaa-Pro peptidase family protein [unclassified Pseudoalteromonas]MDN3380336.1 Xaa-Pro peptidase family protein [Pseudoalteromonas sp. APC 3893]MDN3388669.1 Xaa-Pro peptidase family protein [Pseudoalteromonas sp. APC 4017]